MAASINAQYGGIATAANPGRIDINIPAYFRGNVVGFVATIEELPIVPDNRARVVVNERTGTIVMGGEVAVNECAITQGGISIRVARDEQAVQPDPLSYGTTIVTNNTTTEAEEDVASTVVVPATASISDIVGALNAVGATARDTISILQAMKAAGAIHADLEII
jgi:flagellar P-ring protein precursor FlgI